MTIQAFHAKGYGCLRDVHVTLGTRLHAFVGPNDSGKSTLLRGIETVLAAGRARLHRAPPKPRSKVAWAPPRPIPTSTDDVTLIGVSTTDGSYALKREDGHIAAKLTLEDSWASPEKTADLEVMSRPWGAASVTAEMLRQGRTKVEHSLRGARLCQFEADALRAPSGLVSREDLVAFFNERGLGLPGVYQAILGRGDETFHQIRESTQRLFPSLKRLAVVPVTRSEVSLEIELANGVLVRASEMSAGLLYYLAFAAIPYLDPVSALLIEEPENGLHPARITEVIRMLRDFAERTDTQVFMATHSPLVLNELSADEISVVTRPSLETGTLVTPLRATPHFERRSKVYALGELWLAYCDGDLESPLLDERVK